MSKLKVIPDLLRIKAFQPSNVQCVRKYRKVRLEKIGDVEEKKEPTELYASGQTFIHKAFPYRGIIVYSWPVKIHDNAIDNKFRTRPTKKRGSEEPLNNEKYKPRDDIQTYYQVLVDSRDSHGKQFNNKNLSVKYFPEHSQKVIDIPDIDYVAHEDIIPYQATALDEPIQHTAFYSFFEYISDNQLGNKFVMREDVKQAQFNKNSWMSVNDVYKDMTEDIQVTITPFYMGSRFGSSHLWRYSIRVDYLGDDNIMILDKILHTTIDNHPITKASVMMCNLSKSTASYQFYDNILLDSAESQLWGEFCVEKADKTRIRCAIPVIKLNVSDNQKLRLSFTNFKDDGS